MESVNPALANEAACHHPRSPGQRPQSWPPLISTINMPGASTVVGTIGQWMPRVHTLRWSASPGVNLSRETTQPMRPCSDSTVYYVPDDEPRRTLPTQPSQHILKPASYLVPVTSWCSPWALLQPGLVRFLVARKRTFLLTSGDETRAKLPLWILYMYA
jgi:hypothetical protein